MISTPWSAGSLARAEGQAQCFTIGGAFWVGGPLDPEDDGRAINWPIKFETDEWWSSLRTSALA